MSEARADLELPRTTRAILAGCARLERRHPERAAERIGRVRIHPVEPDLDTTPPDLTKIDTDPAHMQGVKVTEEPRTMERPDRVADDLDLRSPQFTLRNTWRLEKYADTQSLDFERKDLSVASLAGYLDEARRCHFERPDITPSLTSEEIRVSVALRRVLMIETRWSSIFGRAEPATEPASRLSEPDSDSSSI